MRSDYLTLSVKKRNVSIDILRFVALMGVIIAHCAPSELWMQIRNFDVPLMVILSAVSYTMANQAKSDSWFSYCYKRIKRLVFPVWIFLTVYFIILLFKERVALPLSTYISSYSLLWGIGYVWIIRVFCVVAIFAPLLCWFCNNLSSGIAFWLVMFLLFFFNECIIDLLQERIDASIIVKQCFITLPYLLVFMVGLRISSADKKEILMLAIIFSILFLALSVVFSFQSMDFVSTQLYKYPPQLYYLSYALAVSLFLFLIKDRAASFVYKISQRLGNATCWVGQHTLWIYLWHILFVTFSEEMQSSVCRFFYVLVSAIVCTYLQCLVLKVLYPYIKNPSLKKNLQILFEG